MTILGATDCAGNVGELLHVTIARPRFHNEYSVLREASLSFFLVSVFVMRKRFVFCDALNAFKPLLINLLGR